MVVVSDEDYSSRHEVELKKQGDAPDTRSLKERLADNGGEEQPDSDPADDFEMPVMERSGGDKLSFYLAFLTTVDQCTYCHSQVSFRRPGVSSDITIFFS